jgi:hypothetical protein
MKRNGVIGQMVLDEMGRLMINYEMINEGKAIWVTTS